MLHKPDAYAPQVIWRPIKGSSQELALDTRAQHTLYTGARGPGKTDTQLMRFRKNVAQGYGSYWKGVIFDREYKNLEDLISKSKRWFYAFEDGAKFKESAKDLKWEWPTGEQLLFRAIRTMDDYWDYHGHEYPFIGWNELTKFPTGELYEAVMSINRSSYTPDKDGWVGGYIPKDGSEVPVGPNGAIPEPIPLEVFSTANPWGAGHSWVKRKFIDVAPMGKMFVTETDVYSPADQKRIKVKTSQIAIFGTYRENIYLDAKYVASLENIKDKNKRKAWLGGSWDIVAGGAIDDLWNESVHVLPRFEIPASWHVSRTFDWGSSQPFSVGWFAESNGEEITMPNGHSRTFPQGSIILISEWYGTEEVGTNRGLKLSPSVIAAGILEREGWLKGSIDAGRVWVHGDIWPGPADNQIGNEVEPGNETIKVKMEQAGVAWLDSDKSKGSRVIGLELLRDRLDAALRDDGPGFYIMTNCRATRSILPTLPRDEKNMDDIDTESEDHIWDMIRYRLLEGSRAFSGNIRVTLPRRNR